MRIRSSAIHESEAALETSEMNDTQRARDNATQQQYRAEVQNFYETHNHQIDGQDARDYLLQLFRDNFPALHADAMEAATACAEDMAIEIAVELIKIDPALLSNLRKPRVQAALVSAQKSYAETGDPDTKTGDTDLGRVLARLVSKLAAEETRGLAEIAFREAIEVAPKLTRRQMNALSVVTIFNSMGWPALDTAAELAARLDAIFSPYYEQIPTNVFEYSYMSASGVGTYIFGPDAYEHLRTKSPNAMRKYFRLDQIAAAEITTELRQVLVERVPGESYQWRLREDAGKTIVNGLSGNNLQKRRVATEFMKNQTLSVDELRAVFTEEKPRLAEFMAHLEATKALWLTPNAVGYLLAKEEIALRFPESDFADRLAEDLRKGFAS